MSPRPPVLSRRSVPKPASRSAASTASAAASTPPGSSQKTSTSWVERSMIPWAIRALPPPRANPCGAAPPHGFALGGGNALIAHGIIDRSTQDVDVFCDEPGGVEAAADAVEAALRDAGFGTERRDKTGGLGDIFYGMG